MTSQGHLFGEPPKILEGLAQYHTPDWLADEMAQMAADHYGLGKRHLRILEPSVGGGALLGGVERLIAGPAGARGQAQRIKHLVDATVVDLDQAWLDHCLRTYPWVTDAFAGDFLGKALPTEPVFDVVLANPPYDDGQDTLHLKHMGPMANAFVVLIRTVALHGKERSRFWQGVHVDELVIIDERVPFTGTTGQIDVSLVAFRPIDPRADHVDQFPRFRHL